MPYTADVWDGATCPSSGGIVIDGYTIGVGTYIVGRFNNPYGAGWGIYEVTEITQDLVTYKVDPTPVVNLESTSGISVYIKHGNTRGGEIWYFKKTGATVNRSKISMVLDGVNFDSMAPNSTFYAYYPGDYSGNGAGIQKYIKAYDSVALTPFTA